MSGPILARDALGQAVPVPAGVDADAWAHFAARVVILPGFGHGCHLWTGPPRDDGYGQVHIPAGALKGRAQTGTMRAHRFAYQALSGVLLDEEQQLLHQCDEPLCCPIDPVDLPAHLRLGDNLENVAEREARGRSTRNGRHGLQIPSRADRRGQARRSRAIHAVLAAELDIDAKGRIRRIGADRGALALLVAEAAAAGEAEEPTLPIDLPERVPPAVWHRPRPEPTAPAAELVLDQPPLFDPPQTGELT